jgi:hypothetical protein
MASLKDTYYAVKRDRLRGVIPNRDICYLVTLSLYYTYYPWTIGEPVFEKLKVKTNA